MKRTSIYSALALAAGLIGTTLSAQAQTASATPPHLYDQARDGVADVVWTVPGYQAGRFPRTQVFELPFVMTNAEATSRAAWDFVQKNAMDEHKDVKL